MHVLRNRLPTCRPIFVALTSSRRIFHKDNMVDLIFVAENPLSWHTANIERNPKHYSFLRYMGSKAATTVQNFGAAKIYFNTLVPVNNAVIKYGVVSRESFIEDLLDWNSLYVSGRLHKPVLVLQNYDDGDIKMALEQNLYSALHASLLLLPESFTEERLCHTLASLSYRGDFRMKFGEDRSKVSNIVKCQMEHFRSLYEPVIKRLDQWVDVDFLSGKAEQDVSPSAKLYHLNLLPKTLQMGMLEEWSCDGKCHDLEDILRAAAYDTECGDLVNAAQRLFLVVLARASLLIFVLHQEASGSIISGSDCKLQKLFHELKR
ncbi:hypothetical protein QYM36_007677 [Artemia franciscana]|uniref:Phosphatidate cytidylyltransferase, mitochondrial n=1 Tax=Artemia franciscana TaxID=6661 RepID=A0AA88ISQ4_ARTSF|nr:hypothetical protein QYM36_007677 [Artemia franciscana]